VPAPSNHHNADTDRVIRLTAVTAVAQQ